jgi:hypothetical protein
MSDNPTETHLPLPPPAAGAARTSNAPVADRTGIWLPWKVAAAILGFFIASGALWTTLGLAKIEDLSDHNVAGGAHEIVLERGADPVPIADAVKAQYAVAQLQERELQRLKDGYEIIVIVKTDLDSDRAERLADRAADKIPNPARSREVWKTVHETALENLRTEPKKPIRAGLERYLD